MNELDWPSAGVVGEQEIFVFANIPQGTVKAFPAPPAYRCWWPSIILLAVPSTGDCALVAIPTGTIQPKMVTQTSPERVSTTPGTANRVNIYKVGSELEVQFLLAVPELRVLRLA